nr:ATP-binding cassette domain-containing protein [Xylanimonas oleitrophica]
MSHRLSFEGVSYSYGKRSRPALTDVTWTFHAGRTVLLGPDGAGKSTLLRLAAGELVPDAGQVRLDGDLPSAPRRRWPPRPPRHRTLARRAAVTGWMPQEVRPAPGLTAREQVAYAGWLRGMERAEAWERAVTTLHDVGLSADAGRPASALSDEQLRRVGLAEALVHGPRLLLLDEPTAGLDPAQRARFRDVLKNLPGDPAMLVSTHQVDDLDELYDQVVVVAGGQVRYAGSVAQLLEHGRDGRPGRAESAHLALVADAGDP